VPSGNPGPKSGRRKQRVYTVAVEAEHFVLLAAGVIVDLKTKGGALVRLMPGNYTLAELRQRAGNGEIQPEVLELSSALKTAITGR
jgi:hypothetical protein